MFMFFRDTIVVCFADGFTGFYSGLVVFAVLGFLAEETGVPVESLPFTGSMCFLCPLITNAKIDFFFLYFVY